MNESLFIKMLSLFGALLGITGLLYFFLIQESRGALNVATAIPLILVVSASSYLVYLAFSDKIKSSK